ncbi:MAG: hypothetical protein K2X01_01660 [Cyanobacteria bacterium]|nr:hypothetical protein [Cyanobacteriota bacterium]
MTWGLTSVVGRLSVFWAASATAEKPFKLRASSKSPLNKRAKALAEESMRRNKPMRNK